MNSRFLGDEPGDMEWLRNIHGCPADMKCALLTGHEDSPERIEAWRRFNPSHKTPPDWVFNGTDQKHCHSDAEGAEGRPKQADQ